MPNGEIDTWVDAAVSGAIEAIDVGEIASNLVIGSAYDAAAGFTQSAEVGGQAWVEGIIKDAVNVAATSEVALYNYFTDIGDAVNAAVFEGENAATVEALKRLGMTDRIAREEAARIDFGSQEQLDAMLAAMAQAMGSMGMDTSFINEKLDDLNEGIGWFGGIMQKLLGIDEDTFVDDALKMVKLQRQVSERVAKEEGR